MFWERYLKSFVQFEYILRKIFEERHLKSVVHLKYILKGYLKRVVQLKYILRKIFEECCTRKIFRERYLKSVIQSKYVLIKIFEVCRTIEIYFEKDIAKLGSRHQCECISQKNCQKVESWWLVGQSGTLFSNTKYKMFEIQNTMFLKHKT